MTAPALNLTVAERVLPRMALNFTTANLDPRVTVTRANATGTRVNSSGYIETVAADTARFDFDPVTKICRGLLIEEARTNICRYSSDLNNAAWSKTNVGFSSNAAISPDGTQNADSVSQINSTTFQFAAQTFSGGTLANQTYTTSAFLKSNGAQYAYVSFLSDSDGNNWAAAVADIISGTITQTSNGASGTLTGSFIQSYGNGWFRFGIIGSHTKTDGAILIGCSDTGTPVLSNYSLYTFAGNSTKGFYVYGGDVQLGAYPTSHIPTTTPAAVRNADVAVMTSTNFSSWWTPTTGAVAVNARQSIVSGTSPWVQFDDATANNIISVRGNTTNPELYIKATTDQAQIDAGTIAANTNYGLGAVWNTGAAAAALNGAAPVTGAPGTIPTVTQARLGCDGTNYLNGWLQSVRYWPQTLLSAEIQAFSKL